MAFAVGCFVGENILYNRTDVSRRNGGVLSKSRTYYVRAAFQRGHGATLCQFGGSESIADADSCCQHPVAD